jgi:hypothetical protein
MEPRIKDVLGMIRNEFFEVLYTAMYRKENIRDKNPSSHDLTTDDLWKIYDMDEKVIFVVFQPIFTANTNKKTNFLAKFRRFEIRHIQKKSLFFLSLMNSRKVSETTICFEWKVNRFTKGDESDQIKKFALTFAAIYEL